MSTCNIQLSVPRNPGGPEMQWGRGAQVTRHVTSLDKTWYKASPPSMVTNTIVFTVSLCPPRQGSLDTSGPQELSPTCQWRPQVEGSKTATPPSRSLSHIIRAGAVGTRLFQASSPLQQAGGRGEDKDKGRPQLEPPVCSHTLGGRQTLGACLWVGGAFPPIYPGNRKTEPPLPGSAPGTIGC